MTAIELSDHLYSAIQSVRDGYLSASEKLKYFDDEYNDLTHALELTKFDREGGHQLAQPLQTNRINRRRAKEEKELIQPLYDLLRAHNGLVGDLSRATAKVHSAALRQSKRTYIPRVRADIFKANYLMYGSIQLTQTMSKK
ncbi:hypothetical protein D3C71_1304580 [compost metagenome]